MNEAFTHARKGDKFFKFVWLSNLGTEYSSGRDVAEAFGSAGYSAGALAALDYHAEVFPCKDCDFIGDSKADLTKHKRSCGKKVSA